MLPTLWSAWCLLGLHMCFCLALLDGPVLFPMRMDTATAAGASVVLSCIMWYHCNWQLSSVTPQATLTSIPKIYCLDILQGYILIQTVLVTEHNRNTDGPPCRGGEWGEVSQAVISHPSKWP